MSKELKILISAVIAGALACGGIHFAEKYSKSRKQAVIKNSNLENRVNEERNNDVEPINLPKGTLGEYEEKIVETDENEISLEEKEKLIESLIDVPDEGGVVGLTFHSAKSTSEAIETFKHIIEKNPDYVLYHMYLGEAYYRNKNWDLAFEEANKILELHPANGYAKNLIYCLEKYEKFKGKANNVSRNSVAKEAVDIYKSQIKQKEEREKNSAQNLHDRAEEIRNKLRNNYREGGVYDTTKDIILEAEKEMEEADSYLCMDMLDPARSSQYSERALKKFSEAERIASQNETYWSSLEEKLGNLNLKMGTGGVYNQEQMQLYDKIEDLAIDAKNILRSATWTSGGYSSRKNLELADEKMNEASRLIDKVREIGKSEER